MAFDIQKWLIENSKNEVLFLYKGEVSTNLIADSLDIIEIKLEDIPSKIKKKIYNILVECLQNLFHHSEEISNISEEVNGRYALCILTKSDVGYKVNAGNFILKKGKDFLQKHLDHINTLDKEELKNLYKEILNNQEFSDKGGGGLGMVDMARKSGSPLEFSFEEYNDNFYFFSLTINILDN